MIMVVEKGPKLRDEHREILDALAGHDALRAEAAMRKHIGRVVDEVEKI